MLEFHSERGRSLRALAHLVCAGEGSLRCWSECTRRTSITRHQRNRLPLPGRPEGHHVRTSTPNPAPVSLSLHTIHPNSAFSNIQLLTNPPKPIPPSISKEWGFKQSQRPRRRSYPWRRLRRGDCVGSYGSPSRRQGQQGRARRRRATGATGIDEWRGERTAE